MAATLPALGPQPVTLRHTQPAVSLLALSDPRS